MALFYFLKLGNPTFFKISFAFSIFFGNNSLSLNCSKLSSKTIIGNLEVFNFSIVVIMQSLYLYSFNNKCLILNLAEIFFLWGSGNVIETLHHATSPTIISLLAQTSLGQTKSQRLQHLLLCVLCGANNERA